MHVGTFLHKLLDAVTHVTRVEALSQVVAATIISKRLKLTTLGRTINLPIQARSGIQKVNRLLGNKHLQKESLVIASKVAALLMGNRRHPEIIVDWSKYPNSDRAILRAALATEGRALTLYEEDHAESKIGNGVVQTRFLKRLKKILPPSCQPIIVTDAGFHNPWFEAVLALGWDYIGRVRGLKQCQLEGKDFLPCKKIFKLAKEKVISLGQAVLTKKNSLTTHLYLVKTVRRGRKVRNSFGRICQAKDSVAYARSNREPWLLASSLKGRYAAKRVKEIYGKRMTIEEAFRDLKSNQYGFGLAEAKIRKNKRHTIWLLIAMLASLIAYLVGKWGESMGYHRQFQTNSTSSRRVLSFFYLGCEIIRKRIYINPGVLWEMLIALRQETILWH